MNNFKTVIDSIGTPKSILQAPTFPIKSFLDQHQSKIDIITEQNQQQLENENNGDHSTYDFVEPSTYLPDFITEALLQLQSIMPDITTVESILLLNKHDLQFMLNLSRDKIDSMFAFLSNTLLYRLYSSPSTTNSNNNYDINNNSDDISSMKTPLLKFVTAAEIDSMQISKIKLSTGSNIIDKHLGGGILPSGITEIVGESGCGKTQIALQLCIHTQLPFEMGGLEGGALYLLTESQFPKKRLSQMINARKPIMDKLAQRLGREPLNITFENDIIIHKVPTAQQLLHVLTAKFAELIHQRTIRLLVIDSIAALVRSEYGNDSKDLMEKTNLLWEISNQLKLISEEHGITVIVINQVTDYIENQQPQPQQTNEDSMEVDQQQQQNNDKSLTVVDSNNSLMVISNRPIKKLRSERIPSYQSTKQQHSPFLINGLPDSNGAVYTKATIPALGLSWAHFVNTRIMLHKTPRSSMREMKVILSSSLPNDQFNFYIDTHGVIGVDESDIDYYSTDYKFLK